MPLSLSQIAGVRALVHADTPIRHIADTIGITVAQVRLAAEGFQGRAPGYDTCHVGALRDEGMAIADIAKQLGLTVSQVRGAIQRCAR